MSRPTMTRELAWAAGTDAGNNSMRRAGRSVWNKDDYDLAVDTFNRLNPPRWVLQTYYRDTLSEKLGYSRDFDSRAEAEEWAKHNLTGQRFTIREVKG